MRFITIILIFFTLISCKDQIQQGESEEPQWEQLFNGKNLNGWTMKISGHPVGYNLGNTFRVEDGILKVSYDQYGDDFADRFGALYFNKSFEKYRLGVEYRFVGETAPGAPSWGYRDSGIQFHSPAPDEMDLDQPFPICLEYNLHGGNGEEDRPVGAICANGMRIHHEGILKEDYCTPPTVSKTFHGDQWVRIEIDVKGDSISHFVNGEKILSYTEPVYNFEHDLTKKLIANKTKHKVDGGYISLQSNSHPIEFRKIEIIEY